MEQPLRADTEQPPPEQTLTTDTEQPPLEQPLRADTEQPPPEQTLTADTELPPPEQTLQADTEQPRSEQPLAADKEQKTTYQVCVAPAIRSSAMWARPGSRAHLVVPGLQEWLLAKAIFGSLDSGIHQLVSHLLRTHVCEEPYILATNRCLSVMHPVRAFLPHAVCCNA